jgi:predicted O-methyltransferase YrrM
MLENAVNGRSGSSQKMNTETEKNIRAWSATAEGWCTVEHALDLAQLIIDTKPAVVVEIGTFAGGSLIPQAIALKEVGAGKVYGIDPWSKEAALEQMFTADPNTPPADVEVNRKWWSEVDLDKMLRLCMEGIWRFDLESYATVIRARSQDCGELFPSIDICYIDGNHSEVASCRDVELYLPKVKAGGHVWFDDAQWASTQPAQVLIQEACDLVMDKGNYRLYRKK